jgi:hypothetical protein
LVSPTLSSGRGCLCNSHVHTLRHGPQCRDAFWSAQGSNYLI